MSKKPKKTYKPDVLLMRYGGLGDSMFITAIARVMAKQGRKVAVVGPRGHGAIWQRNGDAVFFPATRRNAYFASPAGPVNLVETSDGHMVPAETLFPEFVNREKPERVLQVVDYFQVIENNSQRPHIAPTMNSDYVNAYDMHLAWAGIDPTTIEDDLKRPVYHVSPEERKWAQETVKDLARPIVLVQPHASSPARTYMRGAGLAKQIKHETGGSVIFWNNDQKKWQFELSNLALPQDMDPIRATGALVEAADLVISVDTFISHLAEAVGTTHLTMYSTVPAWTRSKYYKHEITVDAVSVMADRPCYCHVITNGRCPRRERIVIENMSDFDKFLLYNLPPDAKQQLQVPPEIVPPPDFKPPHMLPAQIQARQQSAAQNWHADRHSEAVCIESVELYDWFRGWHEKEWKK